VKIEKSRALGFAGWRMCAVCGACFDTFAAQGDCCSIKCRNRQLDPAWEHELPFPRCIELGSD